MVALLAACTATQVETLRMRSVLMETVAAVQDCAAGITSKPQYADLGTKTHFGRSDTIPEHKLSDARVLTREDSIALLRLYGESQECRRIMLEGAVKMHPLIVQLFIEWFAAADRIYVEAIFGRITWGQFNSALRQLGLSAQARFERAEAVIAANAQNPEFENEQRLLAIQAIERWVGTQTVLVSRRRAIAPQDGGLRSIRCNYVGPRLECRSS